MRPPNRALTPLRWSHISGSGSILARLRSRRAAFAPLFLFCVAFLAGCATGGAIKSPPESDPSARSAPAVSRYNLTGYSEAFKQGYGDACAGRRNAERFTSDNDYQMGWNDGRSLCRR